MLKTQAGHWPGTADLGAGPWSEGGTGPWVSARVASEPGMDRAHLKTTVEWAVGPDRGDMNLEERVAYLEGWANNLSAGLGDLRRDLQAFQESVERRFDEIDRRFDEVDRRFALVDQRFEQVDRRFEQIDARLDQIDGRLDQIDGRFAQVDSRFEQMERRFERLESRLDRIEQRFEQRFQKTDEKIDRTFTWVVGLQAATFVAVLGTVVGALYR